VTNGKMLVRARPVLHQPFTDEVQGLGGGPFSYSLAVAARRFIASLQDAGVRWAVSQGCAALTLGYFRVLPTGDKAGGA